MSGNLTFLLGAGASVPFFEHEGSRLTTRQLSTALLGDAAWRAMWDRFEAERSSRPFLPADSLDLDEALRLRDLVADRLRSTGRFSADSNFEFLIHLLDRCSTYLDAYNVGEIAHVDSILLGLEDTLRKVFPQSEHDGWRYLPWLTREIVMEEVLRFWENMPNKENTLSLLTDFYEEVAQRVDHVSIYSLNYDPLMWEALKRSVRWTNGHAEDGQLIAEPFRERGFLIGHLHGHVALYPHRNSIAWHSD